MAQVFGKQFIELGYTFVMAQKQPALPVYLPLLGQTEGYEMFMGKYSVNQLTVSSVSIVDDNSSEIVSAENVTTYTSESNVNMFGYGGLLSSASNAVGIGEKFYICIKLTNNIKLYSQPLVRIPMDGFAYIRYRCNEKAFGLPFGNNVYVSAWLPIRLHSPQNVQDDKTYVKADGEVVTLYAKYYKEWDCLTEFVSEAMHDKIVAALSCDEVYINNKRVTKSDKYQVDWDNYDLDCDGVTKLAKATFKVREHITQRNSNY